MGTKELPLDGDFAEALAPHLTRIAALCSDGYLCGEIIDDQFKGWWEIIQ